MIIPPLISRRQTHDFGPHRPTDAGSVNADGTRGGRPWESFIARLPAPRSLGGGTESGEYDCGTPYRAARATAEAAGDRA